MVVDLINSLTLTNEHGSCWFLLEYRTYAHADVKFLRKIDLQTESTKHVREWIKRRFININHLKITLNNTLRRNIFIR